MQKQSAKKKKSPTVKYQQMLQRTQVKEGSAQRLALMHSRYLNSILDPIGVPGAKIPDEITTPSFTTQVVTKFTLVPTYGGAGYSSGVGIARLVGAVGGSYGAGPGTVNFAQLVSGASSTYTATAISGTWAGGTTLDGIANMTRPVSAAIYASVQGTANTNQGRIIVGFAPPNDALGVLVSATSPASLSAILAGAFVSEVAVAKNPVARAIYLPTDAIARTYCPTGYTGSPARGNLQLPMYGVIFAIYDGALTSGPATVEFTVVENFEVIPANSQANILNPTASHSDPLELAATCNFLSSNPRIVVEQPRSMAECASPDGGMKMTQHAGPSFLDSVLSGVEKTAGTVAKVAPIAASLLAML